MPIHKKKVFIVVLIIIAALVACYFLFGKDLIMPPRASEALSIYNIDSRGADGLNGTLMPTRTVRWESLPVAIYNKAGLSYLQDVIDEWNQAIGQEVFTIGGPDSLIRIETDSEVSPVGFITYQYQKRYLFRAVRIVINPEPNKYEDNKIYSPEDIIKNKLGNALGFFGHTTTDVNGVMDVDRTKANTIITPFVVSILKELYSLSPGTRGVGDPDLKWLVKKYNIDPQNSQRSFFALEALEEFKESGILPEAKLPTRTMRWRSLPVAVYDKDNIVPDLQSIIDEWNQAMGQEVLTIGSSDSPIVIEADVQQGSYKRVIWTPKKSYLLYKVQIINNPNWVSSSKIKNQLGNALGFFGSTTDDPGGIMDVDYNEQKIISPLVVSVLKELYKLSPATKIVDEFGRTDQEVLALRQAVKKYNIEPRTNQDPILLNTVRIIRWRSLPVSIYNQANIPGLQSIIDEWNTAMDQEVFKIGSPDSPIVIEADTSIDIQPNIDSYYAEFKDYLINSFKIRVNPQSSNLHYLEHQLSHALGFFGHTSDDSNSIMNIDHTRTDTVITPFVVSVIKELYNLSPGVLVNY